METIVINSLLSPSLSDIYYKKLKVKLLYNCSCMSVLQSTAILLSIWSSLSVFSPPPPFLSQCSFVRRQREIVNNILCKPGSYDHRALYLGMVDVPSQNLIINLPMTYTKLHCKGEPYQFSPLSSDSSYRHKTSCFLYFKNSEVVFFDR